MAKTKGKRLKLHLVSPLVYKYGEDTGIAKYVTFKYTCKVQLIKFDGKVCCPILNLYADTMLAPVIETEEEIREMVDGELEIVEYIREGNSNKLIKDLKGK